MYQDILTSLATHDERLSESIAGLSNSNSTQSQAQDTNINNTPDIETIERRTKLIVDTQNLYEKKTLEYSGINVSYGTS